MREKIEASICALIGATFVIGFIAWFLLPTLWYRPLQRAVRDTEQHRTLLWAELRETELVTLTLQPRLLETGLGTIPEQSVQICSGLPVTDRLRTVLATHWLALQPATQPTIKSATKPMEAFPGLDAPAAWFLLPPVRDGQELGFQASAKGFQMWNTDRYQSRVYRFRAQAVTETQPPRYRLKPIGEVDIDHPYYGRP